MTGVKFEKIKICVSHIGLEERILCNANMIVNNKHIPVQIQRSKTGEWVAISLDSNTLYPLSANNKESFEDWLNDPEAYICGVVPQQN